MSWLSQLQYLGNNDKTGKFVCCCQEKDLVLFIKASSFLDFRVLSKHFFYFSQCRFHHGRPTWWLPNVLYGKYLLSMEQAASVFVAEQIRCPFLCGFLNDVNISL